MSTSKFASLRDYSLKGYQNHQQYPKLRLPDFDDELLEANSRNVAEGQSTIINGQPVQLSPNGTGGNIMRPYAAAGGKFGSGSGLVGYTEPPSKGFGLNLDTFNAGGNILSGLGRLGQAWAAIKGLGIAKDQLAFQREAFATNVGMQKETLNDARRQYNNDVRGRQQFIEKTHANPDFSHLKTLALG